MEHQPSENKSSFRTNLPQAPEVREHLPESNYEFQETSYPMTEELQGASSQSK
jgi:hypothetical protein